MARFTPMTSPSAFRKLAASVWRAPNDPTLLGVVDVEFTAARAFTARYNRLFGTRITPTHLAGRAAGLLLAKHPEANAVIGRRRIWLRQSADVFFVIASENGRNLTGRKIAGADGVSLAETERRLRGATAAVRDGKDEVFGKGHDTLRRLPLWLARPFVGLTGFVTARLGIDLPALGAAADPYGGAMISSLGMYGFDTGFGALMPGSDCGFMILLMEMRDRPWVVGDRVEPRPVLRVCCTTDHRIVDGYAGAILIDELRAMLTDPERLLTEAERAVWLAPDPADAAAAPAAPAAPAPSR